MAALLFSCQVVADSFATPWTVACQHPLSMGVSRQEHWNGLPWPPPGDLPDPDLEPVSPAWQADSSLLNHLGTPHGWQTLHDVGRRQFSLLLDPWAVSSLSLLAFQRYHERLGY